jgi:hypothetical protein
MHVVLYLSECLKKKKTKTKNQLGRRLSAGIRKEGTFLWISRAFQLCVWVNLIVSCTIYREHGETLTFKTLIGRTQSLLDEISPSYYILWLNNHTSHRGFPGIRMGPVTGSIPSQKIRYFPNFNSSFYFFSTHICVFKGALSIIMMKIFGLPKQFHSLQNY